MKKLALDPRALKEATSRSLCFKCGSARVVSSVADNSPAILNGRIVPPRLVCKPCYDTLQELVLKGEVIMFGCEGFLDENFTIYDMQEIEEKHDEFNEQFKKMGYHTRFKITCHDWRYTMEMVVHRDEFQRTIVKAAESAMEKLCKNKIRFVKR